jgi:hypothetical protein
MDDECAILLIPDGSDMFVVRGASGDDPLIGEVLEAGSDRPRRRLVTQAATLISLVVVLGVVLGALVVARHSAPLETGLPAPTDVIRAGPSAGQLAHGRWQVTEVPPIYFAYPSTVWTGSALVAFDGRTAFPAQAAVYRPRTNRWTRTAPPPDSVGADPVGAWEDGRLVLISRETGLATSWRPSTNRWTRVATLPASGVVSVVWDGEHLLAITAVRSGVGGSRGADRQAHAFVLGARRWVQLPDLPQPPSGPVRTASAAVDAGVVYVVATGGQRRGQLEPGRALVSVELLRLDSDGWTVVPGTTGLPVSQPSLSSVDGGLLVTGSTCPAQMSCSRGYVMSLIKPSRPVAVTSLEPPSGTPYPGDIAGGGHTIVVGNGRRSYWIYDTVTSTWRVGPKAPALVVPSGVYWTPRGILTGGGFLRPSPLREKIGVSAG